MINFNNYKKLLFLDENEKKFCEKKNIIFNSSGDSIVIQCTQDPFYLKLFSLVINQEKENTKEVYGIITLPLNVRFIEILLVIPLFVRFLINYGAKRKLKIMYSSIGVSKFIDYSEFNLFSKTQNIFKSIILLSKIKTKQQLISFSYKGIRCGDLIYDTIVRFDMKTPTVKLKSFFCFSYFYKCINQIDFFSEHLKKLNFKKAFFSQAVYIYHGVPLRIISGIVNNVYTAGNFTQMFKRITKQDFYMMENHTSYKEITERINISERNIKESLKIFQTRFDGKDDTGYINLMTNNPYLDYEKFIEKNISFEGVLFLHDFYDAHKLYGEVFFNDFYEWAIYTLDIIRHYNLKIAIKPHPYQVPESLRFQKKLASEYSDLVWLDPLISNKTLINNGIKFGITHHGTVISELAYFNINCIYCAENPVSAFDIGYFAKNKSHYKSLILEANNLKIQKNIKLEVGKYYYIHYLHKSSDYIIEGDFVDGINIKNFNRINSTTKELLL